jgi:hypothetical protein
MADSGSTINPERHPLLDTSESITQSKNRNLANWRRWLAKGNNHQKYLDYLKKWRLKNKEHAHQYRLKNREQSNEYVRQWKLRNKEKVAEYRRTGRLRKQEKEKEKDKARLEVLKQINELVSRSTKRPSSRLSSLSSSEVEVSL